MIPQIDYCLKILLNWSIEAATCFEWGELCTFYTPKMLWKFRFLENQVIFIKDAGITSDTVISLSDFLKTEVTLINKN